MNEVVKLIGGGEKKVRKHKKLKKEILLSALVQKFVDCLPDLSSHTWRLRNQLSHFKECREQCNEKSASFVVDFSENYQCRYHRATQASHFGASMNQATLHTGCAYVQNDVVSFCTISESFRHDPSAIWAHLQPVFGYVLEKYPGIDTIHIFSDGPVTQYRNRKNFYLISTFRCQPSLQKVQQVNLEFLFMHCVCYSIDNIIHAHAIAFIS